MLLYILVLLEEHNGVLVKESKGIVHDNICLRRTIASLDSTNGGMLVEP